MTQVQVMFYVMAFIVLASALFVAATKNLVRSIFMFFVTLLGLAGLYVLCLADFVAITQVVIYVGGILVLILFAFMLSGKEHLEAVSKQTGFISLSKAPALILAGLFLVVFVNIIFNADINNLLWIKQSIADNNQVMPGTDMTGNIGINLMTRYLLPFEAISILLMIALIGSAHIARKEKPE